MLLSMLSTAEQEQYLSESVDWWSVEGREYKKFVLEQHWNKNQNRVTDIETKSDCVSCSYHPSANVPQSFCASVCKKSHKEHMFDKRK